MTALRHPNLQIAYAQALTQFGTHEIQGPDDSPDILKFQETTWFDEHGDDIAWCSSFMNWCMIQARLPHTESPRARSWLDWGEGTKEPVQGDLCILTREGGGHVGFLVTGGKGDLALLGGNQSDKVSIETYPESRVLGFRTMYATFAAPNGPNTLIT